VKLHKTEYNMSHFMLQWNYSTRNFRWYQLVVHPHQSFYHFTGNHLLHAN